MSIGLTMDDIKKMDVGIMLDLITSKSNMYIKEKKKQTRKQSKKERLERSNASGFRLIMIGWCANELQR